MSLSVKEKELVSVGVSLAAGCKTCANFHFKKVRGAGASDEEIEQAMTDGIAVRDKAKKIMERQGFRLLGLKFSRTEEGEEDNATETSRMKELVSIASAYAVNCTSSLKKHLATARSIGVAEDEIEAVLDLARFIKGQADSYCCKLI